MKISTLCFLVKDDSILLGMKKRGFGMGKWNGIGGKVNPGETVETATIRELAEEVGVTAHKNDLVPAALLNFRSINPELNWDVHVFFLKNWTGVPAESEEIRPEWHNQDKLPFESMWVDDKHWFPYVLSGKRIEALFQLDEAGKKILEYTIREL